jgi:hypothetical protein
MSGSRAKQIRKDVHQYMGMYPEVAAKYGFNKIYKDAKRAWMKRNG